MDICGPPKVIPYDAIWIHGATFIVKDIKMARPDNGKGKQPKGSLKKPGMLPPVSGHLFDEPNADTYLFAPGKGPPRAEPPKAGAAPLQPAQPLSKRYMEPSATAGRHIQQVRQEVGKPVIVEAPGLQQTVPTAQESGISRRDVLNWTGGALLGTLFGIPITYYFSQKQRNEQVSSLLAQYCAHNSDGNWDAASQAAYQLRQMFEDEPIEFTRWLNNAGAILAQRGTSDDFSRAKQFYERLIDVLMSTHQTRVPAAVVNVVAANYIWCLYHSQTVTASKLSRTKHVKWADAHLTSSLHRSYEHESLASAPRSYLNDIAGETRFIQLSARLMPGSENVCIPGHTVMARLALADGDLRRAASLFKQELNYAYGTDGKNTVAYAGSAVLYVLTELRMRGTGNFSDRDRSEFDRTLDRTVESLENATARTRDHLIPFVEYLRQITTKSNPAYPLLTSQYACNQAGDFNNILAGVRVDEPLYGFVHPYAKACLQFKADGNEDWKRLQKVISYLGRKSGWQLA